MHLKLGEEGHNDSELLNSIYKVDVAMGPQGKNLVNKAYRFTKGNSIEDISTQDGSSEHESTDSMIS